MNHCTLIMPVRKQKVFISNVYIKHVERLNDKIYVTAEDFSTTKVMTPSINVVNYPFFPAERI